VRSDAATILIVEDDPAQQIVLRVALEARGMAVHLAGSARAADELLQALRPDLILLDLGLPDADGFELCRHLRRLVTCPILVVTAQTAEDRVVQALDLGADDYVTKPFSMPVLLARLRVALRRQSDLAALPQNEVLHAGDLTLDIGAHQLRIGSEVVEMPARQFAVLAILVRNEGRVVTYTALGRALGGFDLPPDVRNPWRVTISKLRRQLGDGPSRPVIETELNVGYRLVVPGADALSDG
jgi:two-component system KDP operon response regulator KdpE